MLEQERGHGVLALGAHDAFLWVRDLLAAFFLLRGRWTRWVSSRGRAPWSQGAFLGRRWRRHLLRCITHAGPMARQQGMAQGSPLRR